jgi:hypothetical protein
MAGGGIAQAVTDLLIPPSNRLEVLSGDRKAQYSIRINDQYSIGFTFHDAHRRVHQYTRSGQSGISEWLRRIPEKTVQWPFSSTHISGAEVAIPRGEPCEMPGVKQHMRWIVPLVVTCPCPNGRTVFACRAIGHRPCAGRGGCRSHRGVAEDARPGGEIPTYCRVSAATVLFAVQKRAAPTATNKVAAMRDPEQGFHHDLRGFYSRALMTM